VIRTIVAAPSEIAREGLAAVVRSDARLALVRSGADVLLETREGPVRAAGDLEIPTVSLVDDPRERLAQIDGEDRGGFAVLGNDATPEEIVAAIVAVAAGLVALAPRALAAYDKRGGTRALANAEPVERLTPREKDVLEGLARGVPNKAIALDLHISEHTVKFHVASIFAKLGATSRTEAVAQGVRRGLIML
jgi:DNA-binding NarL/FixJ family response regulator